MSEISANIFLFSVTRELCYRLHNICSCILEISLVRSFAYCSGMSAFVSCYVLPHCTILITCKQFDDFQLNTFYTSASMCNLSNIYTDHLFHALYQQPLQSLLQTITFTTISSTIFNNTVQARFYNHYLLPAVTIFT